MTLVYNCNTIIYTVLVCNYSVAVPKRFRQTIRKFLKQKKKISVFKNKPLLINTFKKYLCIAK